MTAIAAPTLLLPSPPSQEMVLEIQLHTFINEFLFSPTNADNVGSHKHKQHKHEEEEEQQKPDPEVEPHLTRSYSESMVCLAIEEVVVDDDDDDDEEEEGRKQRLGGMGNSEQSKEGISHGGIGAIKNSWKKPPLPPSAAQRGGACKEGDDQMMKQKKSSAKKFYRSPETILLMRTSSYSPSSSSSSCSNSQRRRRLNRTLSASSSSSDSASSMWALIFTLLFATIVIGQDLWSHTHHGALAIQASHGVSVVPRQLSDTPSATLDTGSSAQSIFDDPNVLESLERLARSQSLDTSSFKSDSRSSTQNISHNRKLRLSP